MTIPPVHTYAHSCTPMGTPAHSCALVLTLDEAAAALGVCRKTLDNLRRSGALPTHKLSPGRVVVRRADLEKFVAGLERA